MINMITNENLQERLKQILFNITVNYKDSGYVLNDLNRNYFIFNPISQELKNNRRYEICLSFNKFIEEDNSKLVNIESSYDATYSPIRWSSYQEKKSIDLLIGGVNYNVNLDRLETAQVLNALQNVVTNFEDNLTEKVLMISGKNQDIDSLDELKEIDE